MNATIWSRPPSLAPDPVARQSGRNGKSPGSGHNEHDVTPPTTESLSPDSAKAIMEGIAKGLTFIHDGYGRDVHAIMPAVAKLSRLVRQLGAAGPEQGLEWSFRATTRSEEHTSEPQA